MVKLLIKLLSTAGLVVVLLCTAAIDAAATNLNTTEINAAAADKDVDKMNMTEINETLAEMNPTATKMNATAAEMNSTATRMDATAAEMNSTATRMDATAAEMNSIAAELHAAVTGKASWLAEPLSRALWGFAPRPVNNSACAQHSELYTQHLANLSLWAVQMLDASALVAGGVVAGDVHQLGHFDSCLAVNPPPLFHPPLMTQFCVPTIEYRPYPVFTHKHHTAIPSVWDKVKPTTDLSKLRRDRVYWGLCLPASCKATEIESELNATLHRIAAGSQLQFNVTLEDIMCYNPHTSPPHTTHTTKHKSTGFYVMSYLLLALGLVLLLATIIDILLGIQRTHTDSSTAKMEKVYKNSLFLQLYSVRLNLRKLLKKDRTGHFDILNGLKFILLFFVVTGHRGLFNMGTALSDPEYVEQLYKSIPYLGVMNGNYMVDGYLTISGFLTFHKVFQMLNKTKQFNFIQLVIYRWLRMIPVYMFIVAFYAFLLPHLGKGPLWQMQTERESRRCRENWWTNLLFLNNYIRADDQCLLVSWYLACDLHFFILGSLLVYAIWCKPNCAWYLLLASLATSIAIPFSITYFNNYYGVLRSYTYFYADPVKWFDFYALYGKTHNRAAPYVSGIITGLITHKMKEKKLTIPPQIKLWFTVLLILIIFPIFFSSSLFYFPEFDYSALWNALYASTHRVLYAIFLNWLITIQVTTGWEVLSGLLCPSWAIPLSRLSLCALLIHPLLQFYSVATLRTSEFFTYSKGYYVGTADIIVSYVFSLLLYLIIEAPCSTLQNILFAVLLKSKSKRLGNDSEKQVRSEINGIHVPDKEENTRV